MTSFSDKLKSLSETFFEIEKKLGLTKFVLYSLFIMFIVGIFNFSNIVEYTLKIQTQIEKKEHERRLVLRDDLIGELNPQLVELRSSTGASRLLYFEYHNSTENFVGIPFKFANLVLTNQRYECPGYNPEKYKDINSGLISGIYTDLRRNKIVINKGVYDTSFRAKYPDIDKFFSSQDGSVQQMFINIPGVSSPIGMIVLEWVEGNEVRLDEEWKNIEDKVLRDIPRINALISKYTP